MTQGETGSRTGNGWMLAIDTSTEWAGIALGDGSRTFARSWDAGRTQTTSVLPAIDAIIDEAGTSPSNLAAIAIASGPGTFTGLRVGMSIVKGLVLARGIPLIGVPTLDILAAGVQDASDLVALLPAGRGRVVWQRYGGHDATEPKNSTVPELLAALVELPDTLVVGELAEAHRALIEQSHAHVRWQHRDPAVLLALARERWQHGNIDDAVLLEPRYLHGVTVAAGPVQDRLKKKPGRGPER